MSPEVTMTPGATLGTLLGPDDTWAIWAIIALWVAASIALEQRYRWVSKISGPVLVMIGAVILSTCRVIPTASAAYDAIEGYIVPVCIPLLLFRSNLVTILRETGWMFLVFHFSAIGTVIGAFAAAFLLSGDVPHAPEIAGIMTGSYIGGSVNFVALKGIFDPGNQWGGLVSALMVADNVVMAMAFFTCFGLVGVPALRRLCRTPHEDAVDAEGGAGTGAAAHWKPKPIALLDIAAALALAVAVAAVSNILGRAIRGSDLPELVRSFLGQPFLLITVISVALATALHSRLERVAGAEEIGTYLIYLFFFAIGAPADVIRIFVEAPKLFLFCGVMAAANILVTLVLVFLSRRTLEEASLGINASLGGAPSAGAMAVAKGWTALVRPAILVGMWGYIIGTHVGLVVGRALEALLGKG